MSSDSSVAALEAAKTASAAESSTAAAPSGAVSEASSTSADAAAAPAASASSGSGSKALETRDLALSGDQIAYLNLMSERYKLGSLGKAARVLVNYADKDGDQRFIFTTFRCRKCGIKFPKQTVSIALYPHQWAFLQRMKESMAINDPENNGKPFRILIDFTQEGRTRRGMTDAERATVLNALEKDIFEKVRCNDPVCTHQH